MKVSFDIPTDNITRLITVLKVFEQTDTLDEDGFKTNHDRSKSERKSNMNFYDSNSSNLEEREHILLNKMQKQDSKNIEYIKNKVRPKQLVAMRTILILKYFVAQNKFKSAYKPYDFNDAIKQVETFLQKKISKILVQ